MRISYWSSDVCSSDLILTNHRDRRLASRPNVRLRIVEDVSRCAISDEIGPGWDGFGMTFVMIAHTAEISSSRFSHNGACIAADLAFMYNRFPLWRSTRLVISSSVAWLRSEAHTSELQSLMRTSYAVFF